MNADQLLALIRPNFFKKHSLDKELIVSLTSYPKRFNILPFTIKSILNQSVSPDRIILWLYKRDYDSLPSSVRDLERLGRHILLIEEDWKSYNKIIPTLLNFPDAYIITCDDDVLYKPTLIEELIECHQRFGGAIAQRAHIIQFGPDGVLLPYSKWIENTPSSDFFEINSPLVFPTGVGGVLYPPNCFLENITDMEVALKLCPTADDLWLYFMANHNNTNFSLVGGRGLVNLNQDQNDSLWVINSRGENDRQLNNLINEFGLPQPLAKEISNACDNVSSPNTVKLRNGKCIQIKNDHLGKIISRTEYFYEHDLIGFVKRHVSPKRVVDVGINIGNHAVGFAGHPDYQVFGFEPDEALAKIAKKNLEMNLIRHEIFTHGLGAKDEELSFIGGTSENSGVGRFDRDISSPLKLPIKRMDDCIPKEFEVDLIKVDVEGFELDVLRGAVNTIQMNAPTLIIEHQSYDHYCECKDIILELGYRPVKVFCATPTFVYVGDKNIHNSQTSHLSWVDCWSAFTKKSPSHG